MRLSIVIVTYNSEDDIRPCLQAARVAAADVDHEIVVVDNMSVDSTLSLLLEDTSLRVYRPRENIGFGRAVNAAVEVARADHILLLNPDAILQPGAVDALLSYADTHPDRLPLGGRSVHEDGSLDPRSCWGLPSVRSTATFAFGLSTIFKSSKLLNPEAIPGWARDDDRQVGVVTGSLLLVTARAWRQLGGFDPRFFMYGEDTDLSIRAARLGYKPAIVPGAVYLHPAGASSTPLGKLLLVLSGKATYMRKNWTRPAGLAGVCLLQLGVGVRSLAERLLGRRSIWTDAWSSRAKWRVGFHVRSHVQDQLVSVRR